MAESAYTFRQGDLPNLDLQIDQSTEFTTWCVQWESYSSLSGLSKEETAKQVKALMLSLLRERLTIVQNLGLTVDKIKQLSEIITAM